VIEPHNIQSINGLPRSAYASGATRTRFQSGCGADVILLLKRLVDLTIVLCQQ
jgi:hypothetical protein